MKKKEDLSLYIHIPFCRTRCGYCDFITFAGRESAIPAYLEAVKKEIIHFARHLREKYFLKTIYFGGGTPSLIPAKEIGNLIGIIKSVFEANDRIMEVSLEANPNGLTKEYLRKIRDSGINRLSIGMQSAVSEELKVLDRCHTLDDVIVSVNFARESGLNNLNLDLMYAFPYQTLPSLIDSINQAIYLQPEHLSVYGLLYHDGTPLQNKIENGLVDPVDEDLAGDMYAWLIEKLPQYGYGQYEISNWAHDQKYYCQHNLAYWRNATYLGIGTGAHSHIGNYRWNNVMDIQSYIDGVPQSQHNAYFLTASQNMIRLAKSDKIKETLMMGLRLTQEGVSLEKFKARFDDDLMVLYGDEIIRLQDQDLVEIKVIEGEKRIRLTKRGYMLGNQVFMAFL